MKPTWEGAWQIIRFNWPSYLFSVIFVFICLYGLKISLAPKPLITFALVAAVYFSIASLLASHWIYDLSPLADWAWLPRWLPGPAGRWMLIQTGFDSSHGRIQEQMPKSFVGIVDLYGMPGVGGSSVRRAHKENNTQPAEIGALPQDAAVCDTILAVFSLHEIKCHEEREDFFRAMTHALSPGGRIVLVEHLRDWKNFMVFGSGFFHFLPDSEWRRCAAAAGLTLEKETSVTPFVHVFLLRKS